MHHILLKNYQAIAWFVSLINKCCFIGIENLISTLKEMTYLPNRKGDGELVFNVDHCFSIKGQGTVLTGTILQGIVKINDVS